MKAEGFPPRICACQQYIHRFRETMSSQHHEVEAKTCGECVCHGDRVKAQLWPQFLKSILSALSTSYFTSPARVTPLGQPGKPRLISSSWQKCCYIYTFQNFISSHFVTALSYMEWAQWQCPFHRFVSQNSVVGKGSFRLALDMQSL